MPNTEKTHGPARPSPGQGPKVSRSGEIVSEGGILVCIADRCISPLSATTRRKLIDHSAAHRSFVTWDVAASHITLPARIPTILGVIVGRHCVPQTLATGTPLPGGPFSFSDVSHDARRRLPQLGLVPPTSPIPCHILRAREARDPGSPPENEEARGKIGTDKTIVPRVSTVTSFSGLKTRASP